MYLENERIVIEPVDLLGLDDKTKRIVSRVDGKLFLRKKPIKALEKTITTRDGGWQFDENGKKFNAGPEVVDEFTVKSCDEEFYTFSFWFNMFLTLKSSDLYHTRCKSWIENG
jgi:hypothetical protein